jgi:sulfotransferase family protein
LNQVNSKNGPIFIVGAPRSGTTLLQRMLRSHPRISSPTGESHFIIPLYRNASTFGDLRKKQNLRKVLQEMYRISQNFLDTDLHGMRFDIEKLAEEFHARHYDSIPAIISGLFERNARGEGKSRWLDKTPYYILHLPKIRAMFPDSQIIHIIRDGRDCALSMIIRKYDLHVYNVYHAAKLWQQYVETGQAIGQELGSDVYYEIRYEDILADPVGVMQKICVFLEEEYNNSLVNFEKSSEPGKTPLLKKPIQQDNAEKWRRLMTPWQIRIFESAAGDILVRNGYPVITRAKPLPLLLRAIYRIHSQISSWYYRRKFIIARR